MKLTTSYDPKLQRLVEQRIKRVLTYGNDWSSIYLEMESGETYEFHGTNTEEIDVTKVEN